MTCGSMAMQSKSLFSEFKKAQNCHPWSIKIIALLGAIQNLENGNKRLVCRNLCQNPPQKENLYPYVSKLIKPKDSDNI